MVMFYVTTAKSLSPLIKLKDALYVTNIQETESHTKNVRENIYQISF
mgnify:CR=1 FL=1